MSWIAVAIGTAGVATAGAAAYGASQTPDMPDAPNYGTASRDAIYSDAYALPTRRMIDAAARLGIPITITDPATGQPRQLDFTGLGDADVSGQNADRMAQTILEIQQKYGARFVAEARRQLQAADPQGFEAHERLWDMIEQDLAESPDRPVATNLRDQVLEELNLGANLDPETRRQVEQQVRGAQISRGGGFGTADIVQEAMTTGLAGEQRRTARQQKALALLSSGTSPEDVAYREKQQKMANVGAFIEGKTPTAQFGQLSGAQNGAAPFVAGAPLPVSDPNAGQAGANFASQVYGQQLNYAANAPNPWLQGIGLGLRAVGTGIDAYSAF